MKVLQYLKRVYILIFFLNRMIQNSCSGERYGPLVSNYEKRLKYKHNFGLIQTVKAYKSLEEKKIMFYFNKL